MRTGGALALRNPSSWKPARDGRSCPVSAPFLEPPRGCAQPPRLCPLSRAIGCRQLKKSWTVRCPSRAKRAVTRSRGPTRRAFGTERSDLSPFWRALRRST
eukprot:6212308-Pleurochrysis_carterae.AAC.3